MQSINSSGEPAERKHCSKSTKLGNLVDTTGIPTDKYSKNFMGNIDLVYELIKHGNNPT